MGVSGWRSRSGLALTVLALLGTACTGGAVEVTPTGSAPAPGPTASEALSELFEPFGEVRAAPAVHRDLYAGAAFDLPESWVYFNDGYEHNYAPAEDALWVFRSLEASWAKPQMFTITVTSQQNATARALAKDAYEYLRADEPRSRMQFTVASRRAERVRGTRGCKRCHFESVYVPWDGGNTLKIQLLTYRGTDLRSRVEDFESIVGSLRAAPRDPYAARVRAYLQAIAAGRGAERYLSGSALADSLDQGLYESNNCGRVRDWRIHVVIQDAELGTLYVASAGDRDILQMDPAARSDPDALPMILAVQEYQECGTS